MCSGGDFCQGSKEVPSQMLPQGVGNLTEGTAFCFPVLMLTTSWLMPQVCHPTFWMEPIWLLSQLALPFLDRIFCARSPLAIGQTVSQGPLQLSDLTCIKNTA